MTRTELKMFSSILRWLDGESEDNVPAEPVDDGQSGADASNGHAGRPAQQPPPPNEIDIFNEHIAGARVALAEHRLNDAAELVNELYKFLDRMIPEAEHGSDPRYEMAYHLSSVVLQQITEAASFCPDITTASGYWGSALLLRNSGEATSLCESKTLSLFQSSIEDAAARMDSIRRLLRINAPSSRSPIYPDWLFVGEELHPFYSHHAAAVARMMRTRAESASGGNAATRANSGDSEKQQPHIECLTKIFSDASQILTELINRAPEATVQPAASVHRVCSDPALSCISAYKHDNMLHLTRRVANAMLDHAYAYDQRMVALRREAAGGAHRPVRMDVLQDFVDILPEIRKAKTTTTINDTTSQPAASDAPFRIQLDLALGIVDEAADEVSFLCQVVERYLRFVSTAAKTGNMLTPSRMNDALSRELHAFQSDYVLVERAYIVTSARHAIFAASAWGVCSVHENFLVKTFEFCDNIFFILSKAIARSMAAYNDIAAAATINYVATCMEDTVMPAMRDCLVRCKSASSFVPTYRGRVSTDTDEFDAALAEKLSGLMRQPPAPASEPDRPDHHADRADVSALSESHTIVSLNTIVTAAGFAQDLMKRALSEASLTFPGFSLRGGNEHLQLRLPFQELQRVVDDIVGIQDNACTHFVEATFRDALDQLRAVTETYDYQPKGVRGLRSGEMQDPVVQCVSRSFFDDAENSVVRLKKILAEPFVSNVFILEVARQVCLVLERSWSTQPVNVFGGLTMQQQLVGVQECFEPFISASIRSSFRRLHQISQILGCESVSDINSLVFPVPALTQAEVKDLLQHHATLSAIGAHEVQLEKISSNA